MFTNLCRQSRHCRPSSACQQPTFRAKKCRRSLGALVDTISTNHGVDPALVRAVMKTESNFNRWAVSPKGRAGSDATDSEHGQAFWRAGFLRSAAEHRRRRSLSEVPLAKFNGNLDLSLAAYNAGENLVERLGRIPSIPETANYVRKIRAIYKEKSALDDSDSVPLLPASHGLQPLPPRR